MLAMTESPSRSTRLAELLTAEGLTCELIPTPRPYAKAGCSYSIRFEAKDISAVRRICMRNNIGVKILP